MSDEKMHEPIGDPPQTDCLSCAALWAHLQRNSYLLETLAEERFPDQQAFDEWIERQIHLVYRKRP